jgi:HPt (histidine-containing phosphotransfer) domain-containing protein
MPHGPAERDDAAARKRTLDAPVFDAGECDELIDMIGEDGAAEMVMIFESETRLRLARLARLAAGGRDIAATVREMHTLKGAAGTVAAPRLAALGRRFENAAGCGVCPSPDDLTAIEVALDAFLAAFRARVT